MRLGSDMFACTKCQKREFQMTQLSEMRLLAECAGCGASFVVDSVSEKKSRIEAADPNQHLIWNWKREEWLPESVLQARRILRRDGTIGYPVAAPLCEPSSLQFSHMRMCK